MRRRGRGGPGEFTERLARVEGVLAGATAAGAAGPLRLLGAVLRHQAAAATTLAEVTDGWEVRLATGCFPLLDLDASREAVAGGIGPALAALAEEAAGGIVPEPLAAAGQELVAAAPAERVGLVEDWLEDQTVVEPRAAFWIRVAAAPVLEPARAVLRTPSRDEWTGPACPACGGLAQVSVIAEESGEFMGGSPRSLVCGRCAGWWTFPRAMCTWCAEDDPGRLPSFLPEGSRAVRIDACQTCGAYVKTFDLRAPGGVDVVPLVDDVATMTLDVWAHEQGWHRPLVSLAGV